MSRRSTSGRGSGRPGPAGGRRPHRASKQSRSTGGVSPELIDDTAAGRRMSFRTSVIVGALPHRRLRAHPADQQRPQPDAADRRSGSRHRRRRRARSTSSRRSARGSTTRQHLERLARENLQYVHEGEEAFIVVDSPNDQGDEANESEAGASKAVRAQPWYIELADSLRAVGYANEEDPT